jgi:hypothetical protein
VVIPQNVKKTKSLHPTGQLSYIRPTPPPPPQRVYKKLVVWYIYLKFKVDYSNIKQTRVKEAESTEREEIKYHRKRLKDKIR